jgi:hypothetical protein
MHRYVIEIADASTFVVIDIEEQREICICSNYDDFEDAKIRAENIVKLLNENNEKTLD